MALDVLIVTIHLGAHLLLEIEAILFTLVSY